MASSGKSFYDTREFNTFVSALTRDSAGVPTPAYKELVRTYNNNITNGQFKSVNAAKKAFINRLLATVDNTSHVQLHQSNKHRLVNLVC